MNQPEQKHNTQAVINILDDSEVLIEEQQIDHAIKTLALELNQYFSQEIFKDQIITVYTVMNGGLYFSGQLLRYLKFPLKVKYLHATRYGDNTRGDNLQWERKPTSEEVKQKNLLLLDDIFDEGITLEAIAKECQSSGAASVISAVLIDKQHQRKPDSGFTPDFIGLEVEDRYIFGCGMDYKGLWRNLPAIYALKA